jgi:hypothetical protein
VLQTASCGGTDSSKPKKPGTNRWQEGDKGSNSMAYRYEPLDKPGVEQWSEAQINMLSPAEKYDIYSGRYGMTLVDQVRKLINLSRQ